MHRIGLEGNRGSSRSILNYYIEMKRKGGIDILKKLAKLIDVKSLVTLALTAAFIILSLRDVIKADQFMTVFTVVISFYFGTQVGKKEAKEAKEEIEEKQEKEE